MGQTSKLFSQFNNFQAVLWCLFLCKSVKTESASCLFHKVHRKSQLLFCCLPLKVDVSLKPLRWIMMKWTISGTVCDVNVKPLRFLKRFDLCSAPVHVQSKSVLYSAHFIHVELSESSSPELESLVFSSSLLLAYDMNRSTDSLPVLVILISLINNLLQPDWALHLTVSVCDGITKVLKEVGSLILLMWLEEMLNHHSRWV